jgi:hypothetical protein
MPTYEDSSYNSRVRGSRKREGKERADHTNLKSGEILRKGSVLYIRVLIKLPPRCYDKGGASPDLQYSIY